MDLNLIKRLVKIVDTSGVTDLEIEENGLKVKIAKKIRSAVAPPMQPQFIGSAPPVNTVQQTETSVSTETSKQETTSKLHEVKSPIVGTFYRAPAPDADSYVEIGSEVSPGSVLCIIEAMKLMNEIESDVGGKIVKIMVENGKPVEYNQTLFLVEPN